MELINIEVRNIEFRNLGIHIVTLIQEYTLLFSMCIVKGNSSKMLIGMNPKNKTALSLIFSLMHDWKRGGRFG